jgi:histidine kinase
LNSIRLSQYIKNPNFDITFFLNMAIGLAEAIGEFHQGCMVHRDIRPEHIMIDSANMQITITGLDSAVLITGESLLKETDIFKGTLAYMSPEQTGRTNRGVDFRSDLFSLGVTLYEVLTGRLPIQSTEPMEHIHLLLTQIPVPPQLLNPDIPQMISDIVVKCLAKTAEDRYQSAYGLKRDLLFCLHQWETFQYIDQFDLGEFDVSCLFHISGDIIGRDRELSDLSSKWELVCQGGVESVLITGAPGVGKTALIKEMNKRYVQGNGIFISGKFDQVQRNIPYASLVQAFREYIHTLLTESDRITAIWREKLSQAIGLNGGIIAAVIPEIELLVGRQSSVPDMPSEESQNRFLGTFIRFIQAFASKQRPLMLFIDDWQWADEASKKVIRSLVTDINTRYLFLVSTFRTKENMDEHHVPLELEEITANGGEPITIFPLNYKNINQLLSDTLHCDPRLSQPLAEMVYRKTAGNPFFIRQFLMTLYREKLIFFNSLEGVWQWDQQRIDKYSITGNVVELLVSKFHKLEKKTRNILKLASCMGNTFGLASLKVINNESADNTYNALKEALEEGLIAAHESLSDTFVFLHDHVQQAVYSCIETEEKVEFHYKTGILLLKNQKEGKISDRVFEIANHLIEGKKCIKHETESIEIAHIYLQAALQAKASIAYDSAIRYIKEGLELLDESSWNVEYELTYRLYLMHGQCEYLNGNFAKADCIFDQTISMAESPLDKAQVFLEKSMMYRYVYQYEQASEAGLEGLQLLGIPLKPSPGKIDILLQLMLTEWDLFKTRKKDHAVVRLATSKEHEVSGKLLMHLGMSVYFFNKNLLTLSMLMMLRNTLKYGNTVVSSIAYCNYGMIQCVGFWNFKRGYRFGQIAMHLSNHIGDPYSKGSAYFVFGGLIHLWRKPLNSTFQYLSKAFDYNVETGNFTLAGSTAAFSILTMLSKGDAVDHVLKYTREKLLFVINVKDQLNIDFFRFMERILCELKLTADLRSESRQGDVLSEVYDEEETSVRLCYVTLQIQVLFLLGQYEKALEKVREIEPMLYSPMMMVITPELHYYHSLLLTRYYDDMDAREQKAMRKILRTNLKMLKRWAKGCPENFLHKYLLVSAEMKRIMGDRQIAAQLYDQAIDKARTHQFAALFYLSGGQPKLAKVYMTDAYHGYQLWGADAVSNRLKTKYEKLIFTPSDIEEYNLKNMDVISLLQASQTISGEIVLDNLLKKLMSIVIRTAGAQRGVLILQNNEKISIEAEGFIDETGIEHVRIIPSVPVQSVDSLPLSVINYVTKSQHYVVLHDAINEGMYTEDDYIQKQQCRSVFCIPCMTQGRLIGMIYLQNDLTTHAFTSDLLEVISFLSSQAAISIENARLYSHMEQKVNERTKQLVQSNQEMEHINEHLKKVEHSRRELLANISHELGTPLQSIQGYVEAMLDRLYKDEAQKEKYLRLIHTNVVGVNRLVGDLFQLSKIEGGQLYFQMVKTSLCPLITGLYHKYEIEVKQAGIDFDIRIDLDDDGLKCVYPLVRVDSDRIDQVIANLIHNAVRYTPKGGKIHFEVKTQLQDTNLDLKSDVIIISITDNGSGIAEEHIQHIFDRFYKGNKPLRGKQGSGLGLFISKDIVEHHGGQMWVESIEGQGSTFYFTLQLTPN